MANQSTFVLKPANTVEPTWGLFGVIHVGFHPYIKDAIFDDSAEDDVIYCSDACAEGINEAIKELDDPNKYERFLTIEDFLKSLD
jgi:hypothetical protein